MPSISVGELFGEEISKGLMIFSGGKNVLEVEELKPEEVDAIQTCVRNSARILEKISPSIARDFKEHESVFIKFGQVAKKLFGVSKPITYPSEPGTIGVNLLIPQALKYAASADVTNNPCWTNYTTNSWEISLTAGTAAYLLGDGTNYYKPSPTTNKHELIVIMKDGVVEIGSTPKIRQMLLKTEVQYKYSPWTVHPLIELPIEDNKAVYQYNTLGVVPLYHTLGTMWGVMPEKSGTSTILLIGLFFYEHDFFSSLTYVS